MALHTSGCTDIARASQLKGMGFFCLFVKGKVGKALSFKWLRIDSRDGWMGGLAGLCPCTAMFSCNAV